MSKSINVDFVTRQIEVDTDGKEHFISAAMAAKDAEQSMFNAQNAANAAEAVAPEYAKTKEVLDHIISYTNTATEQANIATTKADAANTSATNAARSYANADAIATQLTEYLATKETLTAPAVDKTLLIEGAAADSKVVGNLKEHGIFYTDIVLEYEKETDASFVYSKTGQILNQAGYFTSKLIAIQKGEKISILSKDPSGDVVAKISKWSEDGNFISVIAYGNTSLTLDEYTATEDIEYIRLSGRANSSEWQKNTITKVVCDERVSDFLNKKASQPYEWVTDTNVNSYVKAVIGSNGEWKSSTNRVTKKDYIPKSIKKIKTSNDFYFLVAAYRDKTHKEFMGFVGSSDFEYIPSGYHFYEFDFDTIMNKYPNYYFFVMFVTSDNAPSNLANIQYYSDVYARKSELVIEDFNPLNLSVFSDIATCGDSFTAGVIYTSSTAQAEYTNLSWGKILGRMIGANVSVYASGGADTNTWQTRSNCLPKLLLENPHQLYFLCLGINDQAYVELGTIDDIHDDYTTNPNTFYGNYAKIIEQIKNHAPKAKLIICKTFMPFYLSNTYYEYSSKAIEEIAEHYGIPMIDTRDSEYLCSTIYTNAFKTGHPTAVLYSGIAKEVKRLAEKCMIENLSYFADFVG